MLSDYERSILAAYELVPEASAATVAKKLHSNSIRVQRTVVRLREKQVFRAVPFIDAAQLGYESYVSLFSLNGDALKRGILKTLTSDPRVAWLGTMGGSYQFGAAFLARSIREVHQLLSDLSRRYEDPFLRMEIVTHLKFTYFGHRYIGNGKFHSKPLTFGAVDLKEGDKPTLDDLDTRILRDLELNGLDSLRTTSRNLGESPATISRRIQRLKEQKILCGYFLQISPEMFDCVAYRVFISVRTISNDFRERVSKFAANHYEVLFATEALGAWQFELGIALSRPARLPEFLRELEDTFSPQLLDLKVLSEIEDLKWSMGSFLTEF